MNLTLVEKNRMTLDEKVAACVRAHQKQIDLIGVEKTREYLESKDELDTARAVAVNADELNAILEAFRLSIEPTRVICKRELNPTAWVIFESFLTRNNLAPIIE